MVIGDRETDQIEHFSPLKKRLQRLGQRGGAARLRAPSVPDTTSGFRAYNREAALQMQVVSKFTYTLETIIQAGKMLVAVDHVADPDQRRRRASRACSRRCGPTCGATRVVDLPHLRALRAAARVPDRRRARRRSSARSSGPASSASSSQGEGGGHIQSLILGSTLFIVAVQLAALGVVGDILAGSARAPAAHPRARAARGAAARRGALALRAGRQPDRAARPPPAPRPGRATGKTEDRGGR